LYELRPVRTVLSAVILGINPGLWKKLQIKSKKGKKSIGYLTLF